jgi:ribose transport system substrate-binding protein
MLQEIAGIAPPIRRKPMAAMNSSNHNRYLVKSLRHASKVLSAFHSTQEVLRLRDVVARTGLKKAMCFRMLLSLRDCDMLEGLGNNQYRSLVSFQRRRKYRIGYANMARRISFSRAVMDGLVRACQGENVELIAFDNSLDDSNVALRNAERLIRERVDIAIEFQSIEAVAPMVAARFQMADIPVIAVDIPLPGATYYGANNFVAGSLAGRWLAGCAKQCWQAMPDQILLIESRNAGRVTRMRLDGMLSGINEVLPTCQEIGLRYLDGRGTFKTTLARVHKYLRTSPARRFLVGAANDPAALGALRAFQEVGREANCVVVGQNADVEARAEMRQRQTRFIGSVAYFPEKYGDGLVRLALDILTGRPAPQAVFTKHELITQQNVDHFYPNDGLLWGMAENYT